MSFYLNRPRRYLGLIIFAFLMSGNAFAEDQPPFNVNGLPGLGNTWRTTNPYRGNEAIAQAGQQAFNHNCARCHGVDAINDGARSMPAPDLRKLDRYCRRIAPGDLRDACMQDIDDYFRRSVLEGKVIVGVRHMPAWQPFLTQETIWAIKTFLEEQSASLVK